MRDHDHQCGRSDKKRECVEMRTRTMRRRHGLKTVQSHPGGVLEMDEFEQALTHGSWITGHEQRVSGHGLQSTGNYTGGSMTCVCVCVSAMSGSSDKCEMRAEVQGVCKGIMGFVNSSVMY